MNSQKPMGTKPILILLLASLLIATAALKTVFANQVPFRIMLYSGTVFLLDKQQRRIPAVTGQEIHREQYSRIELAPGSKLYLQKRNRLLLLETSGTISITDIENESGSLFSNALLFLTALSKPRSYTRQVKARGEQPEAQQNDPAFFEQVWENIVLGDLSSATSVASEDALAAAAWFHQQGKPERTAYILEHLDKNTHPRNPFFQQLRNDSLRGVPLAGINEAVEYTRQVAEGRLSRFRYKALLIGINQYDHPAWQPLNNPVADISAIRDLLVDMYRFQPEDVILLENPNFSDIIDSFQHLKKSIDDRTRLIIYYAGHGYYPSDEEEGYWIPKNGGDPATQRFFIPTTVILSKMKAIKSRHTLLITDSCFSGSLIRKSRGGIVDSGFYRELSEKRSRQIITSGGLEPVSDSGDGNHSVFAGSLLNILSESRETPLSASELAIELRKSLKNTGARQTPEYGRLYTADDENGEFFFIRRNQSLLFAEKQNSRTPTAEPETTRNELAVIGMQNPPENDGSAFQAVGNEDWWGIGLLVHQGFLAYNYLHSEAGQTPRKIGISASLEGTGMRLEYRKTDYKGGYGLVFDLGQFSGIKTCSDSDTAVSEMGIRTCEEEDRKDDQNRTALSGLFAHISGFTDYSVLVWREVSVQLGGSVQYQYYRLNNFLEEDALDSSTLGICGKSGVTYRNTNWKTSLFLDFCVTALELGGSLHELDEDHASDVRHRADMNFGLAAGFLF